MSLRNDCTLSVIKPDAVERKLIGKIISMFEESGLAIAEMKKLLLSRKEAEELYEVHKDKHFFQELIDVTTEGDVVAMVLCGENAILKSRDTIGTIHSKDSNDTTIRGLYAISVLRDSVHGSDSVESSEREIEIFFPSFIGENYPDL